MLVHDHKVEKSEVFDFRETAPNAASPKMFTGSDDPNKKIVRSFLILSAKVTKVNNQFSMNV